MSARVTIGLCVKNNEKTVRNSINSIINQKYPTELVQVTIVDGCSRDNTLSIIANATAETNMKVEVFSDEGKGLGSARQMVVNSANGKYIIYVDGDVTLFDDFIKEHVDFMEENQNVGVAFGRVMFQEEKTLVPTIVSLFDYAHGGAGMGNDATVYRTETMRQTGGFDINFKGAAEDRDLIVRIRTKGWLASTNKKARFFHTHIESLSEFWREQTWFGYGSHYFSHKSKNADPAWLVIPMRYLIYTLRIARKAYKLTLRKVSFLIPLQMGLGNISRWFGFIKANAEGYGHHVE